MHKQHLEFHAIDMTSGWETPPGYPPDIQQKVLAGVLDERAKRGARTRLLRFLPGAATSVPFVHDYAEEVYLLEGELIVGAGDLAETFGPHTYACRPAGVAHGPFRSETGCLLLETHTYGAG